MKKVLVLSYLLLSFLLVGCAANQNYYDPNYNINQGYLPESGEEYSEISENPFISTNDMPVSTFSADVDTASYSIIRRKLNDNTLPNINSIRIEEMVNYFNYNLAGPEGDEVIHVTKELSKAPWNENHQLLMLGLKTEDIVFEDSVPSNLVFLLDVSGSMNSEDKLPLLKSAIRLLVDELRPQDRISIVVYAGAAGVILDGGDVGNKENILDAIDSLEAGGSTAGAEGIELAYNIAAKNYIEGGNNRVILGTDGDFNVGVSTERGLENLITEKKESGIFLTTLGFGVGNLKDNKLETLANKGNGVYHYIDSILEAKKVFASELGANLVTVAKDVKLQVEFNPVHVKGYRLIGYENRLLSYDDFNNDDKDAGDLGAGHEVIVFYEIIPANSDEEINPLEFEIPEELKYDGENFEDELLNLAIRYKDPDSDVSNKDEYIVYANEYTEIPSDEFLFGTCVVEFGLLLRDSPHKSSSSYQNIFSRLTPLIGSDDAKDELYHLVQKAQNLKDN
ncbi:MAG: VWA domain-containing protein [Candidatus Izemoplasmatales bacterium]|nr:VWA domain-containing protein [Candidatus Izemoplasmatales bacterium]